MRARVEKRSVLGWNKFYNKYIIIGWTIFNGHHIALMFSKGFKAKPNSAPRIIFIIESNKPMKISLLLPIS